MYFFVQQPEWARPPSTTPDPYEDVVPAGNKPATTARPQATTTTTKRPTTPAVAMTTTTTARPTEAATVSTAATTEACIDTEVPETPEVPEVRLE